MNGRLKRLLLPALFGCTAIAALASTTQEARAFCGFYVGGAGAKLFNDATQVVMMRDGTRTVLSMQNTYKGPPENFAMVIPVPVILQKENVKTLPLDAFDKIDKLGSPRLVEYWEQDPCPKNGMWGDQIGDAFGAGGLGLSGIGAGGVTVHVNVQGSLIGTGSKDDLAESLARLVGPQLDAIHRRSL